jgi:TolA-binding protein
VPIIDPKTGVVADLGLPRGDLNAQAEQELRAARGLSGASAAQALEAFVARYPRHPQADNALLEAASVYSGAGRGEAGCAVLARCVEEYPAGDAMPEALERLGECKADRGDVAAARRLFQRVLSDYPQSSAAKRAEGRITSLAGAGTPSSGSNRQGAVP